MNAHGIPVYGAFLHLGVALIICVVLWGAIVSPVFRAFLFIVTAAVIVLLITLVAKAPAAPRKAIPLPTPRPVSVAMAPARAQDVLRDPVEWMLRFGALDDHNIRTQNVSGFASFDQCRAAIDVLKRHDESIPPPVWATCIPTPK